LIDHGVETATLLFSKGGKTAHKEKAMGLARAQLLPVSDSMIEERKAQIVRPVDQNYSLELGATKKIYVQSFRVSVLLQPHD
jgi:hypothetical protein